MTHKASCPNSLAKVNKVLNLITEEKTFKSIENKTKKKLNKSETIVNSQEKNIEPYSRIGEQLNPRVNLHT